MTEIAMGGPSETHLPTQHTNFTRGHTDLEPVLMRGHNIGSEPGILYETVYDPGLGGRIATCKAAYDPKRQPC